MSFLLEPGEIGPSANATAQNHQEKERGGGEHMNKPHIGRFPLHSLWCHWKLNKQVVSNLDTSGKKSPTHGTYLPVYI